MHRTYRDDISGSDTEKWHTTVASIMQGLYRRLMRLLYNHHTRSPTNWPYCKHLNQCNKPFNVRFSNLDDELTLQPWGYACSSRLKVAIRTRPHLEKHYIISWWLMLSPPCEPSAMNHMNCLLFALKRCHRNYYFMVPNLLCIVVTTEILIVIDIVCEVSKSLDTPSNVTL